MTADDLLIRNGMVVTAGGMAVQDIAVKNGSIVRVGRDVGEEGRATRTIDAEGLHVFPGLVDVHVHCNEPGRTEWEGFQTASRALAAGGITSFFDMPLNSHPPTISGQELAAKKILASRLCVVDFGLLGGLTPDSLGSLDELAAAGVVGFKGFLCDSGIPEFRRIEGRDLRSGMTRVADLGLVLMLHAESQSMTSELTKRSIAAGLVTSVDYERARPVASELEAVEEIIEAARATHARVHIVHASCAGVVERVRTARSEGIDISVETCPHYLSLTVEDAESLGPVAKCAPPLRASHEVQSLWECIARRDVDVIASDHSPAVPEVKTVRPGENIFGSWGGISSAQTMLNVLLDEGCHKRGLPPTLVAEIASENPAKRFGLYPTKGTIAPGSDADMVLVALDDQTVLTREMLLYRHKMSPYLGRRFRGRITCTLVRGHVVYEDGKIVEDGFRGRMLVQSVCPKRPGTLGAAGPA